MAYQQKQELDSTSLVDRENIRHVLSLYCRGMDRQDKQSLLSAYWPDGWDDHGEVLSPADFVSFAEACWPTLIMQHMLGQNHFEGYGDSVWVETYWHAHHRIGAAPPQRQAVAGGRYIDLFEKRSGEWRIFSRSVVFDWYQDMGACPEWDNKTLPFADLKGRHLGNTASDMSWSLFGRAPAELKVRPD